ncbi:b5e0a99f-4239-457d-960c-f92f41e5017e [Sclerotinia trifoliorum]|uniref:B5e0a99f-4239-457d-960c-f92f41e5017e n=1 Tax=Sclerotinia trifoliorum TaxID=28548 RepID=A0A8H2VZF7_9HELO|nr:b5e0a99f-4239-457d-960c-f92f41e5017e [Sclerotinia trifoliorum]
MMHPSNSKSLKRAPKHESQTRNLTICPVTEGQNQHALDEHSKSPLLTNSDDATSKKTSKFEGFPLDIVNIILDILYEDQDKATIICLSLTCRSYWNYIQGKPYTYFRFHKTEDQLALQNYLAAFIETWMGPAYRRLGPHSRYIQTPFLSRAVYGNFPGTEEKALDDQWKDYKTLVIREENQEIHFVPRPLGLSADEWFPLAARELKKHILRGEARNDKAEVYSAYRASSLCRWLMFNGGDKWLLYSRDRVAYGKSSQFSLNPLIAMLMAFPDYGKSWPTKSKKSLKRSN